MSRPQASILAMFALTVLATIINVACSNVTEVDHGLSENGLHDSNGYGTYGSYGPASRDVAADESP